MAKLLLLALLAILPLPMVHGQGTPLLFLGPGLYSYGKSEVFSLPAQGGNLGTASCTVPDYPVPDIRGYVAFVQDGYLQQCGGYSYDNGVILSSCYALRDSAWVATTPLMSTRYAAAATTLHNGAVLISGGQTTGGTRLSSSEILTGTTWAPALELPSPRYGHCLLGLSTGEIFLHGGYTGSGSARDTYLSTDLISWQDKASSAIARFRHACTEVTLDTEQEVWVGSRSTSEIYSVATDTWRTGPSLPSSYSYLAEFVSYNGQLYYAEGYPSKYIYQLKAGWTQEDAWEKVGEMSGTRYYYQAMVITQDICEGIKRTPLPSTLPPPTVHGQGTPLLFLGLGYGISDGKSEVFSIPVQGGNLSTAPCTVPDYPVPGYDNGYVAFVYDGFLQLCGGYSSSNGGHQSSCVALRESAWEATPLMSPRSGAAAITLHNGSVLISGGYDGTTELSSSEILTGTTWAPALELPSARFDHCMLALSTGEIFLHGGWTGSSRARDTYLSTDLISWQDKASSEIGRYRHACAEVTLGTEQEVWVGSSGTTEIYSVVEITWRTGPTLPSSNYYPGEFVSYNDQLYYADGYASKNIYQLKAGWTQEDGWEKVGEMSGQRYYYQAMIITTEMIAYDYITPDGSLGDVSGCLTPMATDLASASPTPVSVSCCAEGTITTETTCGNGISCTNICGEGSSGCITLKLEESAADEQVCGASMDQDQRCSGPGCSRKKRAATTMKPASSACIVCAATMGQLGYCPTSVESIPTLLSFPLCCMHPVTRLLCDVISTCCDNYHYCP